MDAIPLRLLMWEFVPNGDWTETDKFDAPQTEVQTVEVPRTRSRPVERANEKALGIVGVALALVLVFVVCRRLSARAKVGILQMDRFTARRYALRLYRQRLAFVGTLVMLGIACAVWYLAFA